MSRDPRRRDRPSASPLVNIAIFLLFVAVTLVIVFRASRNNKTAADYYAAGRSFTGPQNGIAIAGDYLSAASFLGIAGAIAINGYDGFLYSIGFLVAWLVALLLVAELLRNTGSSRWPTCCRSGCGSARSGWPPRSPRSPSSFFYLLAQMAGAGGLVALLLGVEGKAGQSLVIAVVGALMILYVLVGGMKGTTWVQIIKAVAAHQRRRRHDALGAGQVRLQPLGAARRRGRRRRRAGRRCSTRASSTAPATLTKLDFISLSLALVLGTAGLPHVLMRFYTVPTAKEARRSVVWAIWLIGIFYLFTLVLGYGAAALVGPETIAAAPGRRNSAAPLLAFELGGTLLLGHHRGGRVRDDPRGRRRPDHHGGGVVRARHLRQRDQARARQTRTAEVRVARDHRGRHRHPGDPRRHLRQRAEHRVPRGAGLRGRGARQPADDPLLAVLEAVQHPGALWSMYGGLISRVVADHLLAGRVRQAGRPGHGRRACR